MAESEYSRRRAELSINLAAKHNGGVGGVNPSNNIMSASCDADDEDLDE